MTDKEKRSYVGTIRKLMSLAYNVHGVMDWVDADNCERIIKLINSQLQPKSGEWRHYERTITCSECNTEFYDDIMEYCGDDVPRFCPHCGARMNGGGASD